MAGASERLGLIVNTLADEYRLSDYTDNWQRLDDLPGIYVCTSVTRPTWGVNQAGMFIYETNTGLLWTWSGSAWERKVAKGWVNGMEVNTDFITSSLSYVVAATLNVTVQAGGRRHLVILHAPGVVNTAGLTDLAVYRGASLLQEWQQYGQTGTEVERRPRPIAITIPDLPTAGAQTYTLQARAVTGIGGTSTIIATATKPLALDVVEV